MLMKKQYTPDINLYYHNNLPNELAEEIIRFVWLDEEPVEGEFEFVRQIRAKVYRLTFRGEVYYLKIYTPQTMSKIIKNFFRPADAVRYFQTSLKLLNASITVAQPILALTRKKMFQATQSIFVTREVFGPNLRTYLMDEDIQHDFDCREKLISQLSHIWINLANHKLAHHDPHLLNFIVHADHKNQDFQINLIDIDNVYFKPFLPKKVLLEKNLQKLKWQLSRPEFSIPYSNLIWNKIRTNCETLIK